MSDKKAPSAAAVLARIAQERYAFGVSDTGEPYALPTDPTAPRIVRMMRGGSGSLRAELAAAYLTDHGTPPPQQALVDALTALEGLALASPPKPLALRVAGTDRALWLDLGDDTGEVVRIAPDGWEVLAEAPVLRRRTALTAALPRPDGSGDVSELWPLLNVAAPDRPITLAWMVCALMPDIPHPILLLRGEQGTGKSTATKRLVSVVDPSTVPLRKTPRDLDSWTTAAVGSHVVAVDNLSTLPEWLSDALCRASTGDGDVRRRLYTDGDLHVVSFRRVVILNGIDLGAVRDDLADRLVTVDLHRIDETQRQRDADLNKRWDEAAPKILGGLLNLTVQVLAKLPDVHLERSPRMADFARVLATVDQVMGTNGMQRFRDLAGELATDAVTSDPVLTALAATVKAPWRGASADLLDALTESLGDSRAPKGWPSGARALTSLLKRRAPSLRRLGWTVDQTDERGERGQVWKIEPPLKADERADETADGIGPSGRSSGFRQAVAPLVACEDTKTAGFPDQLTTNTPHLSVRLEAEIRNREGWDFSSVRQFVSDALPDHLPVPTERCPDCGGLFCRCEVA